MPSYTYRCENCSHEFDRQQSFSDPSLKKCPNCKKHALLKVYKPASIVFKGSGYYVTDNRSKSRGGSSNANGKSDKPKKEKTAESSKKDGVKKEAKGSKPEKNSKKPK